MTVRDRHPLQLYLLKWLIYIVHW